MTKATIIHEFDLVVGEDNGDGLHQLIIPFEKEEFDLAQHVGKKYRVLFLEVLPNEPVQE